MSAVEMEAPVAVKPPEAVEIKVRQPHHWAGRMVFYWRQTAANEISPLPAMLLEPTRASEGWELNFWRRGQMQGRANVKHSSVPKAGCWTWGTKAEATPEIPVKAVSEIPTNGGPRRPQK